LVASARGRHHQRVAGLLEPGCAGAFCQHPHSAEPKPWHRC
jgi:hypothetical protein